MEGFPVLIFVLVLAAVIGIGIFSFLMERKRREAFMALANKMGLQYVKKDTSLPLRYNFLDALRKGKKRYAYNILKGDYKGYPVLAFDYHYEIKSHDSNGRSSTQHYRFSYFILEQEKEFPELRIYPENLISKLGQMIGFADIDFESAEFSRKYTVRSKDKRFAFDICNPQMIEYLLQQGNMSIEIENQCVALSFNTRLAADKIEGNLDRLIEIRKKFPDYLYRE